MDMGALDTHPYIMYGFTVSLNKFLVEMYGVISVLSLECSREVPSIVSMQKKRQIGSFSASSIFV